MKVEEVGDGEWRVDGVKVVRSSWQPNRVGMEVKLWCEGHPNQHPYVSVCGHTDAVREFEKEGEEE